MCVNADRGQCVLERADPDDSSIRLAALDDGLRGIGPAVLCNKQRCVRPRRRLDDAARLLLAGEAAHDVALASLHGNNGRCPGLPARLQPSHGARESNHRAALATGARTAALQPLQEPPARRSGDGDRPVFRLRRRGRRCALDGADLPPHPRRAPAGAVDAVIHEREHLGRQHRRAKLARRQLNDAARITAS